MTEPRLPEGSQDPNVLPKIHNDCIFEITEYMTTDQRLIKQYKYVAGPGIDKNFPRIQYQGQGELDHAGKTVQFTFWMRDVKDVNEAAALYKERARARADEIILDMNEKKESQAKEKKDINNRLKKKLGDNNNG